MPTTKRLDLREIESGPRWLGGDNNFRVGFILSERERIEREQHEAETIFRDLELEGLVWAKSATHDVHVEPDPLIRLELVLQGVTSGNLKRRQYA